MGLATARVGIVAALVVTVVGIGVVGSRSGWAGPPGSPPPPPPLPRGEDGRPPATRPAVADDRPPATRPLSPLAAGERRVAVTFDGGHDTDARDGGRPVALVAAALGVPAGVFRDTFTHVHPAAPGAGGPTTAEARQNKAALLAGLSEYGVTNDRLDAVSDHYRYRRDRGELWRHRPAVAYAVMRDGAVVRFDVVDGGAGYTTPPTATVDGRPDVAVTATLAFGTDLQTNGSVASLAVGKPAGK